MKLPKTYEPQQYEKDIYSLWEKNKSFSPRGSGEPFSIVMPPPNANGDPHIGYELTGALEDIVIRHKRMKGFSSLLVPGADHAGFETWVVYEKMLNKTGKSRFDFSREELYKQVWDFVELKKFGFLDGMRKIGISCDWDRFLYTLDSPVINQANSLFKQMWEDKLIYRGERLVNYCTFHGTSFSDIEVVHRTEKGKLWYIKYPLTDGHGHITVATTRPETMLGDTAVAVNPNDKKYKQFVGKTVKLPLADRDIPIITDDMVDQSFGTGAVKITPAHDINDYEVGQRHNLPMISVIDKDGLISDDAPENYRHLTVDEARDKVVEDLDSLGLLEKVEVITHRVGHCYKCDTVIQPLLMEQWFVSMKPLAEKAVKVLKNNQIKFFPDSKLKQSIEYLEGIRDWNISRQIPWGIPIPAFRNAQDPDDWIYNDRTDKETIEIDSKVYVRDPDVFDTWFSSGQWPYVTLGYPDGNDFKKFYPTGLMETGGEILYPWVCRMIMLGLYVTGDVPFKEVYIHGYVMAEDGSKMSKSIGNVVSPIPLIDKYGSDAVRMGIIEGRSPAVNSGFDPRKVIEARNFGNKLWNIARYVEDKIGDDYDKNETPKAESSMDSWIITRLSKASKSIDESLNNYRFSEAYETLYHLVWDDFADWYIEASKTALNKPILAYALIYILKLAHPFAPFITETVWQTLKWEDGMLISSSWPTDDVSHGNSSDFDKLIGLVSEVRFIKSTLGLQSKPELCYQDSQLIADNVETIKKLAGLSEVNSRRQSSGLALHATKNTWLILDEKSIDKFKNNLVNRETEQENLINSLEARLSNKNYVSNAPEEIVNDSRNQLKAAKEALEQIQTQNKNFS